MAFALSVEVPCQPFDVAFHPSEPLICSGLISGTVDLQSYKMPTFRPASEARAGDAEGDESDAPTKRCWRKRAHKQACRAVSFMEDGKTLLSGSSDNSLVLRDTETGKRIWGNLHSHTAAVNRLASLTETTVASGDDDGAIKVWDVRQPSCCASMSVHEDFIADMHHAAVKDKLLAVSGDGTLSVFDLRHYRKEARSEYAEDELLSVTVVKNGRKVVCGSQEGVLLLYSWGHWMDCSDRFPGHPQSIDALIKLNEDAVITGSQDGLIRLISILPNGFRGVVGQHMDCPIERLALSADGCILASASHNSVVKVWDVSSVCGVGRDMDSDEEEEEEEKEEEVEEGGKGGVKGKSGGVGEGGEGEEGEEKEGEGEEGEEGPAKSQRGGAAGPSKKRPKAESGNAKVAIRREEDESDEDEEPKPRAAKSQKEDKREKKKLKGRGSAHEERAARFFKDL